MDETYALFHIERVLGHRIDDNYPLSLFLRASKELKQYYEEKNQTQSGSKPMDKNEMTFGGR